MHVYDPADHPEEPQLAARTVTLMLNAQQLELIDRAIAQGAAPDREALVRRAIRDLAQDRQESAR